MCINVLVALNHMRGNVNQSFCVRHTLLQLCLGEAICSGKIDEKQTFASFMQRQCIIYVLVGRRALCGGPIIPPLTTASSSQSVSRLMTTVRYYIYILCKAPLKTARVHSSYSYFSTTYVITTSSFVAAPGDAARVRFAATPPTARYWNVQAIGNRQLVVLITSILTVC